MARSKPKGGRGDKKADKRAQRKDKKADKKNNDDKKKKGTTTGPGAGSETEKIKKTTDSGECPVITMSPTAAAMAGAPDAAAFDDAVYSTGPGEAVMYQYSRQGQYAEEFASQQAEQSAVPAGVNVTGPGQ